MTASTTTLRQLFVIAAPSGAGKTSLVKALLEQEPHLRVSVSHTTRKPRPHEVDGRDYFFVDMARFEAMVASDAFVEHARVFDNYYGTSRAALERAFADGFNVILEIDWQGAQQVRKSMPECTTIFILPPSRQALEERLVKRNTDNAASLARRLGDAVTDMSHCLEFDYAIVNDDFATAVAQLRQLVRAGAVPRAQALAAARAELQPLLGQLLRKT